MLLRIYGILVLIYFGHSFPISHFQIKSSFVTPTLLFSNNPESSNPSKAPSKSPSKSHTRYDLGLGKNTPIQSKNKQKYDLGIGKNTPLQNSTDIKDSNHSMDVTKNWNIPDILPLNITKKDQIIDPNDIINQTKPMTNTNTDKDTDTYADTNTNALDTSQSDTPKKQPSLDENPLSKAVWHKDHFQRNDESNHINPTMNLPNDPSTHTDITYDQMDLSIPLQVYNPEQNIDLVWDLMRMEARREAEREPLLVSFLFSTILNHPTLESALAFHLANRLSSPAMISTQIQSIIMEAFTNNDQSLNVRKSLRADILAVRDRDPACTCLPDVFLYFKGFHALQTYRVAHYLWKSERRVLAHYLQSQISQVLQIDIHPNAQLGSGIMLDHGTGIVIGETAIVGHNCSILHHVTLGGSGKKGVNRHPNIGMGVLIGAGATVLGNIHVGNGVQIGAGTLVISDIPDHCVAVGVPAKIIGSFKDTEAQPSIGMNQTLVGETNPEVILFGGSGI